MNTHVRFKQLSPYQVCELCQMAVGIKQAVSSWVNHRNVFFHQKCYDEVRKERLHEEDEE